MTDTTRPEMRRAVELARQIIAANEDPALAHMPQTSDVLARALLAANDEVERMRAVYEAALNYAWQSERELPKRCTGNDVRDGQAAYRGAKKHLIDTVRATQNATAIAAAGRGREE